MASHYLNTDTIVAAATPLHAVGAIGIVRVSGPDAVAAVSKIVRPRNPALQDEAQRLSAKRMKTHRLYRCGFFAADGGLIDEGMFVWMKSPHSYTGEDSFELHAHGNPYIVTRIVEAIIASGLARAAEPGEFSFRAFRNGKMDLAQAESVAELIAAKSHAAMRLALSALHGSARKAVGSIQEDVFAALALVELDIDFSDQGVAQLDYPGLKQRIAGLIERIGACRERFRKTAPLREGIRTAIVGAPNSGKSTLFNQLLGEDRSIVSDVAGTTRDVVRESILFKGVLLVLSDTAGIRDANDAIEREGIARSFVEVKDAHLVLALVDGSDAVAARRARVEEMLADIRRRNPGAAVILVFNKQDIVTEPERGRRASEFAGLAPLELSAKTGAGLAALHERILAIFSANDLGDEAGGITQARHDDLLRRAQEHLQGAVARIEGGELAPDLLALDLRAAVDAIGEISGQLSTDDLLNFIFSKFCIGK